MPQYANADIARTIGHSRAVVRFYAETRDNLIAEGVPEAEAQQRARTLAHEHFPDWRADDL